LQLLQFQTDVSSAQLALIQALANLRQLLGYDAVPENYDVIGELTYAAVHITKDLEVMALKARPDLMVAERGVTATQSQKHAGEDQWQTRFDRILVSSVMRPE
jgi:cobalt-zinc-cadmium efflux system outer membrane protein